MKFSRGIMKNICYIVGAGDARGAVIAPGQGSLIIAADGGFKTLASQSVKADMIIGDFDSIGTVPREKCVVRHPVEKDDTDMLLAVREGLKRGYKVFSLIGGTGGRLDHTIANIQTLSFIAEHGAIGFLWGDGVVITAVKDGTIHFSSGKRGIVSVFCMGDRAEGVNLRGLKYQLTDAILTYSVPLGVSNQFTGAGSSVEVGRGTLAVLWYEDGFDPENSGVSVDYGGEDGI